MKRKIFITLGFFIAGFFALGFISNYHSESGFTYDFSSSGQKNRRVVFEKYFHKIGPERLIGLLEEKYPLCHNQAHDLGKVLFAETADLTTSIETCADGCSGGCFHGVLMEALKDFDPEKENESGGHVTLNDLKEKMNSLCDDPTVNAIHRKGKCAHGIGHALERLSDYTIETALSHCKLFQNRMLEFYCAGGVFMEHDFVHGNAEANSKPLYYPCDTYTEFPAACYGYKTRHLIRSLGLEKLIKECISLEGAGEVGCFYGIGLYHNTAVEENLKLLETLCSRGTTDDQYACIHGAIGKLTEIDIEKADAACKTILDEQREKYCEEIARLKAYSLEPYSVNYFEN